MLTIVVGRAKTGKSTYCFREFAAEIGDLSQDKTSYLIVPEQYALSSERQLLEMPEMAGKLLFNDEVLSFKRLAYRIISRHGGITAEHLDESGKIMLLTHIAYTYRDQLVYYTDLFDNVWQINQVLRLFSELEKCGISASILQALLEQHDEETVLQDKLQDLSLLFDRYRSCLQENYLTESDLFQVALQKARQVDFFQNVRVWIDSFTGFTAIEEAMLKEMLVSCASVTVTLCMDPQKDEPIFAGIRGTYDRLVRLAQMLHIDCQTIALSHMLPNDVFYQQPALCFLERTYTALKPKTYVPDAGLLEAGIEIHEFTNVFDEIASTAKGIQQLHQQGVPYGKIAVAVGDLASYSDLIEAVLPIYGIPFFVDHRRSVESHPLILSILSLLNIVEKGFAYEDVVSFLRAGLYIEDQTLVDQLDNLILSTKLRGDQRYSKLTVPALQQLWRDVSVLKDALKQATTLSNSVEALLLFTEQHHFLHRDAEIEGFVLDIFRQLSLLLGDIRTNSLSETCLLLHRMLSAGFSAYKLGQLPQNMQAVQIIGIDRSRTSGLYALFFLGVNEGVVPSSFDDNGMLNDRERAWMTTHLSDLPGDLQLADDSLTRAMKERYSIYATLFAPSNYLRISYSLQDAGGNSIMPSSGVVDRLLLLYPGLSVHRVSEPDGIDTKTPEVPQVIGAETARALFLPANPPLMSVSQLESYRKCPYQYFMQYGLRAEERDLGELTFADIGTLMHHVIEQSVAQLVAQQAMSSETIVNRFFQPACDRAGIPEYERESGRVNLILQRLYRFSIAALEGIRAQLQTGHFKPVGFEVPFGMKEANSLPAYVVPLGDPQLPVIALQGKIDRIDAFEDANSLYLRVVDYKSTEQNMTMDDIYLGSRLQLVTYMKALIEQQNSQTFVRTMAGSDGDKPMMPAGILYFDLKDDLASIDSTGKLKENHYCFEGLWLDDPLAIEAMVGDKTVPILPLSKRTGCFSYHDYQAMSNAVDTAIRVSVKQMANGQISHQPMRTHDRALPCTYCAFSTVCGAVKK